MTSVTIPNIPTRQQRRSASQVTSYSACGEAYRLERIARAPRRPAAWFIQGHAFHEAVEAWEKSGRTLPEARLTEIYEDAYINEANKLITKHDGNLAVFMTGGFKKAETDLTDRQELGLFQVHQYVAKAKAEAHLWRVVASEYEFTIEIGGVAITGFVDQVIQNLETKVIYPQDLKTGASVPPMPLQLAIYSLALQDLLAKTGGDDQVATDFATWYHAGKPPSKSGKTKGRDAEVIAVDLTDWGHDRVARWLVEMDRAEKAGFYLPNPSDSCHRICSVAQYCSVIGHPESAAQYARPLGEVLQQ